MCYRIICGQAAAAAAAQSSEERDSSGERGGGGGGGCCCSSGWVGGGKGPCFPLPSTGGEGEGGESSLPHSFQANTSESHDGPFSGRRRRGEEERAWIDGWCSLPPSRPPFSLQPPSSLSLIASIAYLVFPPLPRSVPFAFGITHTVSSLDLLEATQLLCGWGRKGTFCLLRCGGEKSIDDVCLCRTVVCTSNMWVGWRMQISL